jgi:diguanylate cyclase
MLRDDLIVLGLQTRQSAESTTPDVRGVSSEPFRDPIERLLALLRDIVYVVERADQGTLHNRIEQCRQAVVTAGDVQTINASLDACNVACGEALARIEHQRVEQKKEIASLVGLVREALAIVSGDGQSFNQHLGHSMERFEALVRIDDVRQLKAQLAREVGELREMAGERLKMFEETCEKLGREVKTLERQLTITKEEAALDALTRISNRGAFYHASREWLKADPRQFVMAVIDVDDFKRINDAHGHVVGDHALIAVAQSLKSSVRQVRNVVARIGGDEFAVLIADLTLGQAESRLRMLGSSLAAVKFESPTGVAIKLTVSCGLAESSAGDTTESLMERADTALYEAKRLGKNRIVTTLKPTIRDLLKH